MKSNAPWSVKGIERDARETAKEAARREGMTVGEWLNQMIYSQGESGGAESSGGEVSGLKLRDIVTAIEHLRNRVVEAENKNAAAVSDLSRNMGGFVERVQRLERVKPAEGSYQDVTQRLEKLERAGNDRSRIDALKALEKAVAQVAVQFNNAQRTTITRLDSAEAQLQEFAARIDRVGGADAEAEPAEIGALKSAIEDLAGRVSKAERIAEEAATLKTEAADSTDPEFVERTGARLRVLGDEIKRGGDQIRTLEGTIAKLSNQIEAAEKRSADGVQKVSETIAEVRTQLLDEDANSAPDVEALLSAAQSETEEKIETLQRSLQDMNARFEELGRADRQPEAGPAATVDEAQDAATETLDPAQEIPAADVNAQDEALDADALDDVVDEIEEAVAAIEAEDDDSASEDPFAFADDDAEAPSAETNEDDGELLEADAGDDEPADDFSFQLDDETEDDGDDDITVSADAEDGDETAEDAESLLAEVRSALTGEGVDVEEEDDVAVDDDTPSSAADDTATFEEEREEDDDEDRQAPNTASLASSMAIETASEDEISNEEAAPSASEANASVSTKEDMLQAARRRAREAAGRDHDESENRPRRSQLTAKQRAILAARARQKNAEQPTDDNDAEATANTLAVASAASEEATAETPAAALAEQDAAPATGEEENNAEEADAKSGRFGKITATLAAAKARLGRKKDEAAPDEDAQTSPSADQDNADPAPRRNGDREAFETLRSTASVKPLTLALGVAILLALAALIYLVKDFIFKPDTGAAQNTPAVEHHEPTATAHAEETNLPAVPEAPAIDPQALYIESMEALAAASSETAAMAAITKLQDAAALGYPPAQLQLGELYKTGQGVDQDLGQARVWFRRAANGGNVLAMHRIGVMTARGDGGPADSQEAIAWFEQAANYGLVDSQYNLGAIYHPSEEGGSLVQDAGKAYYWYSLASHNGDEQAAPLASGVAIALSPEARERVDADVAAWVAKSADESANLNANAG